MRILVAYDGSISADAAIEDLPRAGLPQCADALVVCVEHSAEVIHSRSTAELESGGAKAIATNGAERVHSHFPQWRISSDALCGSPAKVLVEASERWHPNLFVIGCHGRSGIRRFFLGSVSWELIHSAPCSVRVARPGGTRNPHDPIRIVIGHDGSAEAARAICSVADRAWPEKTEAQIVSAVQTLVPVATALEASTFAQEPAYSVIREADERLRLRVGNIAAESADVLRRAGLSTTTHLVDGDPREAILTAAEIARADTIFLGARGHGPMERLLLGSVSSYIATHAHCSVEVVRGNHEK